VIPKAELHCHIEGAASPALAMAQARKYGVDISGIIDPKGGYYWTDFTSFLNAYDLVASLFKSPEDYAGLLESYYTDLAAQGCIYAEIFASRDHAKRIGCSYGAMVEAIGEGITAARSKTGIVGRIIITGVRHAGAASVEEAAEVAAKNPHPLVTGFGLAGDERFGHPRDFARAFAIAGDCGLQLTAHAGEFGGPQSVVDVLDHLKVSRIGHGVRAIEDKQLVERLAREGIVLEACPGSNIALGLYKNIENHPFHELGKAGCVMTLNSDDPPHFHTSIANEYRLVGEAFGYDEAKLLEFTTNALKAAFVDGDTRKHLLEKCVLPAID